MTANFHVTHTIIKCASAPHLKLSGSAETELWAKKVDFSVVLDGKMGRWVFFLLLSVQFNSLCLHLQPMGVSFDLGYSYIVALQISSEHITIFYFSGTDAAVLGRRLSCRDLDCEQRWWQMQ